MELKKNALKDSLKKHAQSYGIWNGINDSYAAEIAAGAGFDWVLIDGEHGTFNLQDIIVQAQAMSAYPVSIVVRPPSGDEVFIKRLLDGGIQSLLIPMVESKEQAEKLVQAMRYPPAGIRGVGTALARAAQWNRVNNYFQNADGEMCLIVQVESQKGYEALDEILEVEGVDGVFLGPADLAASMGYLGQPSHEEVVAKVKDALKRIRAAGKSAGTLAVTDALVKTYSEAGANFIGLAVDNLLLAKATRALVEKYKPSLKKDLSNTQY